MVKKLLLFAVIICFSVGLGGCGQKEKSLPNVGDDGISLRDDQNVLITLKQPAKRIISLYPAHTENLLSLGLDEEIIGVGITENNPKAKTKKAYDYRADPESILDAQPDLVLIRPFIRQGYPQFVKTLENANIKVVSLYPEKFEYFDDYIRKLALLTGTEKKAETELNAFHAQLAQIKQKTEKITQKKRVYFESTTTEYRTIAPDSTPAKLLYIAGAINIAEDAKSISEKGSIAAYGVERLLLKGGEIDVYIAQKGPMNAGITIESIKGRPGFDKIKAVETGQVYIINENLVSTPTFNLAKGAQELFEKIYPEMQ